jgi:hypothetical protein
VIGIEKIDATELRKVLKVLKAIDPETAKDLRKNLKGPLVPLAQQVANAAPQEPPLSGFGNRGPTGYAAPKGKVAFTPGKGRTGANNLVSLRIDAGKQRGFYIAELAGSRKNYSGKNRGYVRQSPSGPIQVAPFATNSGRSLIEQLNARFPMKGKGGRFAYKQFRFIRPDVVRIATKVLNDTFKKLERMLD